MTFAFSTRGGMAYAPLPAGSYLCTALAGTPVQTLATHLNNRVAMSGLAAACASMTLQCTCVWGGGVNTPKATSHAGTQSLEGTGQVRCAAIPRKTQQGFPEGGRVLTAGQGVHVGQRAHGSKAHLQRRNLHTERFDSTGPHIPRRPPHCKPSCGERTHARGRLRCVRESPALPGVLG
jgi:hypothetical protein